tara:strand:- start:377 stop:589 length:213 start_codon:yes stop_codon:yes gene_type:complete
MSIENPLDIAPIVSVELPAVFQVVFISLYSSSPFVVIDVVVLIGANDELCDTSKLTPLRLIYKVPLIYLH